MAEAGAIRATLLLCATPPRGALATSPTHRTTTEALVPPPRIQRHCCFGVLARTAAYGQIGWRGRM